MKKITLCCLLLLSLSNTQARVQNQYTSIKSPSEILKNTWSLLYYKRDFLRLSEDLNAYDQTQHKISKADFLKKLMTGNYLPLRLTEENNNLHSYKLFKLNYSINNDIRSIIKNWGSDYYKNYSYEGQRLPAFSFADLNNKIYNASTTSGKIFVIKCWFINCHPCIKEIPALNNLVRIYKKRTDIVFLSLAFDPENDLRRFLKTTRFDYPIAHVSENYMENNLKITVFPTHFIINKKGIIKKAVNDAEELTVALNKEALK